MHPIHRKVTRKTTLIKSSLLLTPILHDSLHAIFHFLLVLCINFLHSWSCGNNSITFVCTLNNYSSHSLDHLHRLHFSVTFIRLFCTSTDSSAISILSEEDWRVRLDQEIDREWINREPLVAVHGIDAMLNVSRLKSSLQLKSSHCKRLCDCLLWYYCV